VGTTGSAQQQPYFQAPAGAPAAPVLEIQDTGFCSPCPPALDPAHPLVAHLLHCFASAPCHEYGPLSAFKAPGAVVRAVSAVLQVRMCGMCVCGMCVCVCGMCVYVCVWSEQCQPCCRCACVACVCGMCAHVCRCNLAHEVLFKQATRATGTPRLGNPLSQKAGHINRPLTGSLLHRYALYSLHTAREGYLRLKMGVLFACS
jgi:hypothetical protein